MSEADLYGFLAGTFADADVDRLSDAEIVRRCVAPDAAPWLRLVLASGHALLAAAPFPWRRVASYANRDLADERAARQWLGGILDLLRQALDQVERP
jgi:hypothetical protein